mmetsp:Transcript_66825/g.132460  ORF Transcript_66825/g.132460 Transcript_66825/m.132460 type:complete len:123 (-) Transcript_66825:1404-1772(-)
MHLAQSSMHLAQSSMHLLATSARQKMVAVYMRHIHICRGRSVTQSNVQALATSQALNRMCWQRPLLSVNGASTADQSNVLPRRSPPVPVALTCTCACIAGGELPKLPLHMFGLASNDEPAWP